MTAVDKVLTVEEAAARTGASIQKRMVRMGHDSPQAAMIYQHATSEADGPSPRR